MNSKLRNLLSLAAVSLMLALCIPATGQVLKGSIVGTVADPQGAVVPGASIKATNTATGVSQTTTSDGSGLFRISLIQAGNYKLEVTAKGFQTAVQSSFLVAAGQDNSVGTIRLTVGEVTNTVEVVADAPLIETTNAQVTNTFAGAALQTFAGIQENEGLDNLALFVPGVNNSRDLGFSNTNGAGFAVNGLRSRNNDQQIDGQNNNDNSVGGPGLFVSDVEFVQQYVLVTNQFGPEYGRNAGSVVNVITKSGTNAWHGSIYGTENNSFLNALGNNAKRFGAHPDGSSLTGPDRLNDEFGGFTVGGPIVKNKLFFFGGFNEELISTIANIHTDSLTPTAAGLATLAGCFPGSATLQAWSKFGPLAIDGSHVVSTTVPADNTRAFIPLAITADPSSGTVCDNVQFGGISRFISTPTHNFNWVSKLDWQKGSDTITGRYLFNRGNSFNNDFGDAAAGYPVNVIALSQVALISWTHNLSSHMVNEARVGFGRLNVDFGGNSLNTVPTGDRLDQGVTRITFRFPSQFVDPGSSAITSGQFIPNLPFLGIGTATNLPQFRIVNTWQAQDNWNYVLGKHTIKAGVNWTYQRSPNGFLPTVNGAYRFDGWGNIDAIGLNNSFVLNQPDRVQIAQGPTQLDFREYDTFLYGGDDWKISPNLTLNMGLTWSYYGQPANLFHDITTKQQTGPNPFWNPALPASITTYPTYPTPKNSFGPSLGFAYSPQWGGFLTGHGKTVIRGGYRFLYDPPFYNIYLNQATATPQVFLQTFSGSAANSKPVPVTPLGPNVRNSLTAFLTPGVFDPRKFAQTSLSPNFSADKVNSFSLGIERELTKNSAIEVRYAGNHAYDLFQSINANPKISALAADFPALIPAGVTPCAASTQVTVPGFPLASTDVGRVSCGEGLQRLRTNGGFSFYNSIQTEFRANNLFKQLTVRSGYTFSKTLDNVSEIFSSFGGGATVAFAQNPFKTGRGGEFSFSGLDVPHTFTLLVSEEVPWQKAQKGLVGHLLGGWSISGNYILASGQRYTPAQAFISQFSAADYFDSAFANQFIGVETERIFSGNPNAPATSVGIFAADACNALAGFGNVCALPPGELISLNAFNQTSGVDAFNGNFKIVQVGSKDVRYIANGGQADQVFGTPFGNVARNSATDAISNIANASVFKKIKLTEKMGLEFHATALNLFNHFNFASVDPFIEDAGLSSSGTGFGDPTVTGAAGRRLILGAKFSF
jgi:hypothetical protein